MKSGFWRDRSVLITGGAGLIGSTITKKLLQRGAKVRVLDNFSAYPFDQWKRFGLDELSNVEKMKGDVKEQKTVAEACRGMDLVFHEAAFADVSATVENPTEDFQSNVKGTFNTLRAARENGVEKFIFASSAAVYGDKDWKGGEPPVFHEEMRPEPLSTYANSKLWGERQSVLYSDLYGLNATSLRYFSVYGAPQIPKEGSHSWVIAIFVMRAIKGKPLKIFGDGEQVRDFVHVDDIAKATIKAAETNDTNGEIINIGTGVPTSIKKIAQLVLKEGNFDVEIEHETRPKGDPLGGYADTSKMEEILKWKPEIGLENGLKSYIKWCKENKDAIPDRI